MRLKLLRKSSGGVPYLMCLFAVLTFGQGIEAQEDPGVRSRPRQTHKKEQSPRKTRLRPQRKSCKRPSKTRWPA